MSGLHVETELDDVAVLDDVFFAFDVEFAGFAGFALGAEGDEIVERKDRFKMQGEINNAFKPAQPIGYLAPQKAKSLRCCYPQRSDSAAVPLWRRRFLFQYQGAAFL
jgi:hypothetical protein